MILDQLKEKTQGYSHIIWDWNGTIMDDVHVSVAAISQLLIDQNMSPISTDQYRNLFGFPVQDYYAKLGFDSHLFSELSEKFHHYYEQIRLHEGCVFFEVVQFIQQSQNFLQHSILSAGAQWLLDLWVQQFHLSDYFKHIYGIQDIFAHSKLQRGLELLSHLGCSPNKTLLIGDTLHDIEVGQKLGIDVLIIPNGHQSSERLKGGFDNVLKIC